MTNKELITLLQVLPPESIIKLTFWPNAYDEPEVVTVTGIAHKEGRTIAGEKGKPIPPTITLS